MEDTLSHKCTSTSWSSRASLKSRAGTLYNYGGGTYVSREFFRIGMLSGFRGHGSNGAARHAVDAGSAHGDSPTAAGPAIHRRNHSANATRHVPRAGGDPVDGPRHPDPGRPPFAVPPVA